MEYIDKSELTLIDWVYGSFWREFPALRLIELEKLKKNIEQLIAVMPTDQFTSLELQALNANDMVVSIAHALDDLNQEIKDLKSLIKSKG